MPYDTNCKTTSKVEELDKPSLSAQDCWLALHQYARRRRRIRNAFQSLICCCCQPEEFHIENVQNFIVHKVTLESVLEQRNRYPSMEISMDQANKFNPKMPLQPGRGREFESCEFLATIPGATARVGHCTECNGVGRVDCIVCTAGGHMECDCWEEIEQDALPSESIYGKAPCDLCDGCTHCYRCLDCDGRSRITCGGCDGSGQSVRMSRMLIRRSLIRDSQLLGMPKGLDESLLTRAEGLPGDPEEVKSAAVTLRGLHDQRAAESKGARMTHQRLMTHMVPVAMAHYSLGNGRHRGVFWVLGTSGDLCHCPRFPWLAFGAC